MKKNVGIMGFGRIGRDALRIWALRDDVNFEVTHVAVRNLDKTLKERTHSIESSLVKLNSLTTE